MGTGHLSPAGGEKCPVPISPKVFLDRPYGAVLFYYSEWKYRSFFYAYF